MKKKDIIRLIQANQTITKHRNLLSTITVRVFHSNRYISEELWFPDIPEFKEYFDVLKRELIQAKEETIESQRIIDITTCTHEVRLNYCSGFVSTNRCVLCQKKILDDSINGFGKSTDRNSYNVTFDARYQEDEDGIYEVESGKTDDEVRKIILEILDDYEEDDEVDLVKEFYKLNLKDIDINTAKKEKVYFSDRRN